jgi:hypothetical protein
MNINPRKNMEVKPYSIFNYSLGIVSFSLSIGGVLFLLLSLFILFFALSSIPSQGDKYVGLGLIIGLGGIASILTSLLSIIIGIIGLFETNRNRLFAILGTIVALSTIIFTYLLIFNKPQP